MFISSKARRRRDITLDRQGDSQSGCGSTMRESASRRAVEYLGILCSRRNVRRELILCVRKSESRHGVQRGFSNHLAARAWRLRRQGREFESPRPDKKRELLCSRFYFQSDYVLCLYTSEPEDEAVLHWINRETRRADEGAQCGRV